MTNTQSFGEAKHLRLCEDEVPLYSLATSGAVLADQDLVTTAPIDRAMKRIHRLLDLSPGWNGHGGITPSTRAIVNAQQIARHLPTAAVADMAIVPTNNGGVQLEWHAGRFDIEIEVTRDGVIECVIDDDVDEFDAHGSLGDHWLAIHQAFARIE